MRPPLRELVPAGLIARNCGKLGGSEAKIVPRFPFSGNLSRFSKDGAGARQLLPTCATVGKGNGRIVGVEVPVGRPGAGEPESDEEGF